MGINANETNAGTRGSAPEFDENKANAADGTRQETPRFQGMSSLNSLLNRPLSRSGVDEYTMEYVEGMRKFLVEQAQDKTFSIVPVDRTTYDLVVSAIAVVGKYTLAGQPLYLSWTFLLEPTGGLDTRLVRDNRGELELPTTTADAYDDRIAEAVQNAVKNHLHIKADVHEAGYSVLPIELDPKDARRVSAEVVNAVIAIDGMYKEQPGVEEPRFNVSWFKGSSTAVTGRMEFRPGAAETLSGLPIRNDVQITARLRGQHKQGSIATQPTTLSQIGGYIDLSYIQPQPTYNAFNQEVKGTKCYLPRFVITNTDIRTNALQPELVLFGLATATLLSDRSAWVNAFKPVHGAKEDTRDIGAIGYEVNIDPTAKQPMGLIDTDDNSFDLAQVVSAFFHEDLLYSIDIEEGGSDNWLYTELQFAANGDEDAYNNVIATADNLTDGHFSKLWNGGQIASHGGNLINLGYFLDKDGSKKDLRTFDYLALLNLIGRNDLETVVAWSNTMDNESDSPERRYAERARIQRALLGDNYYPKGYALRYDVDGNFLATLVQAIYNAGMTIAPENSFANLQQSTRGNPSLANMALRNGANPLFSARRTTSDDDRQYSFAPRSRRG